MPRVARVGGAAPGAQWLAWLECVKCPEWVECLEWAKVVEGGLVSFSSYFLISVLVQKVEFAGAIVQAVTADLQHNT